MKSKLKIMVIEDDQEILESLSLILNSRGFSAKLFSIPQNAIEACRSEKFDVVITDLKMPGTNGFEVLKAVRDYNPEACVIIITGLADMDIFDQAMDHGAYAIFRKPILDVKGFADTLHKIDQQKNQVSAI
ncbi:MAG TPA: response regulator [archaeon]|nr:response regulator [archaeon]